MTELITSVDHAFAVAASDTAKGCEIHKNERSAGAQARAGRPLK
jgi:hypothetical protein